MAFAAAFRPFLFISIRLDVPFNASKEKIEVTKYLRGRPLTYGRTKESLLFE
jgi:hypothetical protein